MKRFFAIALMMLCCAAAAFAQNNITVSGTVLDEQGLPMIGVGVLQKGTTNGTTTDLDGKYVVTVPMGSELEYSFVGYVTASAIANTSVINLSLEPSTQFIEETVVIGYGVQKKSSVTGAISSVKSEDLRNRSVTSVEGGLQGKTAGVQVVTTSGAPGADQTIRVRGYSSNSDSTPLYVVDGLRTKSISHLDPSDIESIEVLKDAASAAIYGAQAGNGVILVTTKKAEKGTSHISYDFQYSINKITRMPEVLNAEEYLTWVTEGNLVSQTRIDEYYDGYTDTDWTDVAFENGKMQRHSVTLQGANSNGSILASLSYLYNDGPVITSTDTYERIGAVLNADYKIKPWLRFSTNNTFSRFHVSSPQMGGMYSILASAIQMDPLTPVTYSKDALPAHMQSLLDQGHLFITDSNGDYYSMSPFQESNNINPYIMVNSYKSTVKGYSLRGTLSLDFMPWKTITYTTRLGYNFLQKSTYERTWPHVTNTDTTQDYVTIDASSSEDIYYQWENFVNYIETFNKKHNVSAMVGMAFDSRSTYDVTAGIAGTSASDLGITKLDENYAYFASQTGTATKTVSGGERIKTANLSYFGRVSYDYDNKYFIQASLRADAADTSVLPLENRWGYFPAVSIGWSIAKEKFFRDLPNNPVTELKLRASWGQNGSIAGLSEYMYAATIDSSLKYPLDASSSSYSVGSLPSSTGNNNLKWETSEQFDVGLDLRMWRDRFSFGFDWYRKETKDLIMTSVTSSASVGNTISPLNAGNVVNKGFEFDLGWHDYIGDFSYSISANLSTLDNEVTSIYSTLTRIEGASGGSGVTTYFEKGHPIWYMRGYNYLGVDPDTGYPIFEDVNGDGSISDDDLTDIGSAIPDVTYGITISLAWKGIDFLFFGSGTAGNEICYGVPRSTRMQANTLKEFYDGRWTTVGQSAKYIGAELHDYAKYCQSSAMVFDGSYFKIKQIQLGYTLPSKITKKAYISNLRVYVSLDDFFEFTDYPGFDPEVSLSGSGLGIDYGQYPTTKKVVFGLNLTF